MIKDIISGCIFAVILYSVFGGYLVAMFNGKLFGMQNHEPLRMCAVFQDGALSIDAHHGRAGQSFDYMECGK